MEQNNIITVFEAIKACNLLKENPRTRIPEENIDALIEELNYALIKN